MNRWILLCDLDAFFASVEILDRPELRGRPVIVGGLGPRGVVATCSYEARAMGVRSAMPMVKARELCPQGVFLPPRPQRYRELSRKVFDIFHRFAQNVEPCSIDEAYLEVVGDGPSIAGAIREAVGEATGLSLSIGGGPNKLLAKVASQLAKPGGIICIPEGKGAEVLAPLPVDILPGVGPKREALLKGQGFSTVGDLQQAGLERLQALLGERAGRDLFEKAWGKGPDHLASPGLPRSISAEETFPADIPYRDVPSELQKLSQKLSARLQTYGLVAYTLTLKIRFPPFQTLSRQVSAPRGLRDEEAIFALARDLFAIHIAGGRYPRRVRLLGLRLSRLEREGAGGQQLSFF